MTMLGTAGATEQPGRYGWSPQRGPYTTRVWRGGLAAILQIAAQCYAAGYTFERSGGIGGIFTLEASMGGDAGGAGGSAGASNEIVDDWELLPNKVQKDLLSSDTAVVNALTALQIDAIKKANQNPPADAAVSDLPAECLPVYRLMAAGVEYKVVHQPVLRHSWVIPRNARKGFDFTTVDKILTTNTLVRSEGVPVDFLLPLRSLPTKYSNPARIDGITLVYGWYKAMPTLTLSAYSRRLVQAEYEFGLWSTLVYGAAI